MFEKEDAVISQSENRKKVYPQSRTFLLALRHQKPKENLRLDFHKGEAKIEYAADKKCFSFSRRSWLTGEWETNPGRKTGDQRSAINICCRQ